MSGGHFDYQEFRLNDISTEIEKAVDLNETKNEWGYFLGYSQESLKYMRRMAKDLRNLSKLIHALDYAISGDTSEKNFLEVARKYYENKENS